MKNLACFFTLLLFINSSNNCLSNPVNPKKIYFSIIYTMINPEFVKVTPHFFGTTSKTSYTHAAKLQESFSIFKNCLDKSGNNRNREIVNSAISTAALETYNHLSSFSSLEGKLFSPTSEEIHLIQNDSKYTKKLKKIEIQCNKFKNKTYKHKIKTKYCGLSKKILPPSNTTNYLSTFLVRVGHIDLPVSISNQPKPSAPLPDEPHFPQSGFLAPEPPSLYPSQKDLEAII